MILACGTAAAAKPAGRETDLRPDWEQVKIEVMLARCAASSRSSFTYHSGLLLTDPRPLSPSDFVWGARHRDGGCGGQSLLGVALMRVRDELIADVRTRLTALAPAR